MIISIVAEKKLTKTVPRKDGNSGITVGRIKIQGAELEKIFSSHMLNKELLPRIYEELLNLNIEKNQMI